MRVSHLTTLGFSARVLLATLVLGGPAAAASPSPASSAPPSSGPKAPAAAANGPLPPLPPAAPPGSLPSGPPAPAASPTTDGASPQAAPPTYGPPPPYGYPPPGGYYVPYYAPALPPSPPPADAHNHAGFFLRMGMNVGYLSSSSRIANDVTSTARGATAGVEIDVGGSLVPGFSLAGTLLGQSIRETGRSNELTVLGVMGNVYPNPKGGLFVGGLVGLAIINGNSSGASDTNGIAIAPHVGYDWWVSNYWGLGITARLFYAHAKSNDAVTSTNNVTGATVGFTATYN